MGPTSYPPLRSLVLAGGASRRMGSDKALLDYHGRPQVRHLAALLETLAPPVFVSLRRSQMGEAAFEGLRLLPDLHEGLGPLAGLLAAFEHDGRSAWLAVAVDLPWLGRSSLEHLIAARDPEGYATCFRIPGSARPEPVCAIYEPKIRGLLEGRRAAGRYSLMLLCDLPIRLVDAEDEGQLRDVNEPGEYRSLREEGPRV